MTIVDALILGIVEGVTEFLPISSTGHLILTAQLLGLSGEFVKSFEIAIQLGAILAVLVLYGARFLKNPQIQKNVLVAFLPTAVGGLFLYKIVKTVFFESIPLMLAATALDLIKSGTAFSAGEYGLLVLGGLTAFISALITVRWFVSFISSHDFARFGIYRIALALAWWVAL